MLNTILPQIHIAPSTAARNIIETAQTNVSWSNLKLFDFSVVIQKRLKKYLVKSLNKLTYFRVGF